MAGALAGAGVASGVLIVLSRLVSMRARPLEARVVPWLRDEVPWAGDRRPVRAMGSTNTSERPRSHWVLGWTRPLVVRAAQGVDQTLGGSDSVSARLERAGSRLDLSGFRVEQVHWGLVGFALAAAWQSWGLLSGGSGLLSGLLLCVGGFVSGVLLRDRRLSSAAQQRDLDVLREFPVIAELLALSVAAGEGPVAALDRVCRRSHGALAEDLARVLAQIRTGTPVGRAFEEMSARSAVPAVAQFAQGIAVAVDRGTPLADVLHAQAADVREAQRRSLIESAARREIYMLAPVVFIVLPVTVLFAFYPGLVGLRLVAH